MKMHNEENRFVLYEYLLFFWRKKWLFVVIPVLFVLAAVLFSLIQPKAYEGTSVVYVGGVDAEPLTTPRLFVNQFNDEIPDHLRSSLSVQVLANNQVLVSVTGSNPTEVAAGVQSFTDRYYGALLGNYQARVDATEAFLAIINQRVDALTNSLEYYKDQLKNENLPVEVINRYMETAMFDENQLMAYMERGQRLKTDLLFFEQPEIVSTSTKQASNHLKANIVVGFALGVIFSLIALMLWKYIIDARRKLKHD